ncbi:MAG TPA: hypothetical protein VGP95_00795, partial [Gemmatimonadaceae bacterium]|nr:hypothetical protein [Gemmatimonadaceae bacterium]
MPLARTSVGDVSLLLTAALLLMIAGLIAGDRGLARAAFRQASIDAQQSSYAVAAVLRDSAAMAAPAASPAVKSIIGRWPSERTAAALVIGADTVLVSGPRDALREGIVASSPIEVRDSLPWVLVVAHEHEFGPFRILLGGLSLAAVALLAYGVLRERRQAIRVVERS